MKILLLTLTLSGLMSNVIGQSITNQNLIEDPTFHYQKIYVPVKLGDTLIGNIELKKKAIRNKKYWGVTLGNVGASMIPSLNSESGRLSEVYQQKSIPRFSFGLSLIPVFFSHKKKIETQVSISLFDKYGTLIDRNVNTKLLGRKWEKTTFKMVSYVDGYAIVDFIDIEKKQIKIRNIRIYNNSTPAILSIDLPTVDLQEITVTAPRINNGPVSDANHGGNADSNPSIPGSTNGGGGSTSNGGGNSTPGERPLEKMDNKRPITPGLKPKSETCQTVKDMWNSSLGTNPDGSEYPLIEHFAIITDQGLFVQPTEGMINGVYMSNTANSCNPNYLGSYSQINGVLYFTYQGIKYKVKGFIHTHPNTSIGNPMAASSADMRDVDAMFSVPNYILGQPGLFRYNKQGIMGQKSSFGDIANCNYSLY